MSSSRFIAAAAALLSLGAAPPLEADIVAAQSTVGVIETVAPALGTVTPAPTADSAPIEVPYANVADAMSGLLTVELWYRTEFGGWAPSGLEATSGDGTFQFHPPGSLPANQGTYYFQLVATDDRGNRSAEPAGAIGNGQASTIFGVPSSVPDWRLYE